MEDKIFRDKQLRKLEPIFTEWINLINHYVNEIDEGDVPYWYNERTTLGILAGALWKNDCFVLEEYSATKSDKDEEWSGRVDLWFLFDEKEYIIEAKQKYISASIERSAIQAKVLSELKTAIQDVAASKEHQGQEGLGVVFVVPQILLSRQNEAESLTRGFIECLKGIEEYDIFCYTFPSSAVNAIYGRYFYPGVILIASS